MAPFSQRLEPPQNPGRFMVESYTMFTINADHHPLMNRMHKPDPAYGPDDQDKRSVVPIERPLIEQWLQGSHEEALRLLVLPQEQLFVAEPQ